MYWVFHKVDFEVILEEIKKSSILFVVLALIAGVLSHLARALRWNLLLKPMGYKASVANSFHAVILGYLVNLGTARLGEITRPAVLSKLEGIPFNKLVGTIVTERIIDLIITLLITVSIIAIQFDKIKEFLTDTLNKFDSSSIVVFSLLGIAMLLGILAIRYRKRLYDLPILNRFKSFIEGMVEGLMSIFKMEQRGLFIFYSLFIWLMYLMMPYFILYALPGTSSLGMGAAITVLFFGTAAMIIPVPGGIGPFEILVPAALALYGIAEQTAKAYALLTHSIQILVVVGVGIISIIYFVVKQRKIKNELATDN